MMWQRSGGSARHAIMLSVSIGNNSAEAVRRCQRILGGIARPDEGRQWVWNVHDAAAKNALRWMLPYLTVKREEAEIAVNFPTSGHRRDPVTGQFLPAGFWCRIGQAVAWKALWKGVKGGFGRVPAPIG